jgi:hypothetical protein
MSHSPGLAATLPMNSNREGNLLTPALSSTSVWRRGRWNGVSGFMDPLRFDATRTTGPLERRRGLGRSPPQARFPVEFTGKYGLFLTVVDTTSISSRMRQSRFARSFFVLLILVANADLLHAERVLDSNPDFLVENWLALDGIPESSALALAQTPDGYIWVGSPDGLLRFNGLDFTAVAPGAGLDRLRGVIVLLRTDQSGRLWVNSVRFELPFRVRR